MEPATTELLENEVAFAAAERPDVLILACGAIAREVLAVDPPQRLDARRRPLPAGQAPLDAARRSQAQSTRS